MEKQAFFNGVATQLTAIVLASLGAVLISIAGSMGAEVLPCEPLQTDPAQAGFLGALIKGMHSAFTMSGGTMKT